MLEIRMNERQNWNKADTFMQYHWTKLIYRRYLNLKQYGIDLEVRSTISSPSN